MKQTTYRGKSFTYDDAVQAMARFDKEFRSAFPAAHWKRYEIEFNGQTYPPKMILRLITGLGIAGGGEPINSRFEELGFKVSTRDEPPDTDILEGPDEADEDETALTLEIDLENSLVGNLDQLEKGLKLYRDGNRTGQQFIAKGAGIIDLLANDSNGDLVIIELKAGEADKKVCGQIQAYMGWVKKNLAGQRKVRGIIVANEFTEKLALAAGVVTDLALKKYTIVFRFSNPE
jgi:Endonuclease NucS C-terminal domain